MPWRESDAQRARARDERPVRVPGPDGDLFTIVTPPAPDAPATGLASIHLTRPRSHRNRNWVEIARTLAVRGVTAVRFDYHGTGDSGGDSGPLDPNEPYRGDVVAVLRHVRETLGVRRFVLTGSCFDARTALSAFADEADAIEALLFIAAPVASLADMQALGDSGKDWAHVWRALHDPDNWKRLRDLDRWKQMAGILGRVASRGREAPGGTAVASGDAGAVDPRLHPSFLAHFDALVRSRARALFLYGEEDPEFRTFQLALRDLWPRLAPAARERLVVEVWPGVVHAGWVEMERQRALVARALEWLLAGVDNGWDARPGDPPGAAPAFSSHRPEGTWTSA
jgi:alpha/beta superfamily hydrolase